MWALVATFLIVVFAAILMWAITADPLVLIGNKISALGDSGGAIDDPARIDSITGAYFDMFLLLIFGLILWAIWRVLRREITRGSGGL